MRERPDQVEPREFLNLDYYPIKNTKNELGLIRIYFNKTFGILT